MTDSTDKNFNAQADFLAEVNYRLADKSDMFEVASVFRSARLDALPYLPNLHTPEEDRQFFSDTVFKSLRVHIAARQGRIVGFIAFNDETVDHLYLLPEAQGMGIGHQLLNIAKQCTERLQLWTFQRNERAKRFYAKNGFKSIKETDGNDNEEKEPDVLLEWTSAVPEE